MLKQVGGIRKIETLNRIVVPVEVRKIEKLNSDDYIELYIEENGDVVLKKHDKNDGKSIGIVRRIDVLCRIVIPRSIINQLELNVGDSLQFMQKTNGDIVFRKIHKKCIFCGNEKDIIEFKGKTVCENCIKEIIEL